ncbi:MAG: hypothetical protein ACLP8S_00465 [Solirubrobacteraceae bacterium]
MLKRFERHRCVRVLAAAQRVARLVLLVQVHPAEDCARRRVRSFAASSSGESAESAASRQCGSRSRSALSCPTCSSPALIDLASVHELAAVTGHHVAVRSPVCPVGSKFMTGSSAACRPTLANTGPARATS